MDATNFFFFATLFSRPLWLVEASVCCCGFTRLLVLPPPPTSNALLLDLTPPLADLVANAVDVGDGATLLLLAWSLINEESGRFLLFVSSDVVVVVDVLLLSLRLVAS